MKNMKYLYIEIYFFLFSPFSKLRIKQMIIIIIFFCYYYCQKIIIQRSGIGLKMHKEYFELNIKIASPLQSGAVCLIFSTQQHVATSIWWHWE